MPYTVCKSCMKPVHTLDALDFNGYCKECSEFELSRHESYLFCQRCKQLEMQNKILWAFVYRNKDCPGAMELIENRKV